MKVIGLTGGIGTGKSTIAAFLAELGAVVLDADKVGHEAFRPGTDAWRQVVAAFGQGILDGTGRIDRKKLGEIVFGDAQAMERLNKIMHPAMFEIVRTKIEACRREGVEVLVLEAPLLFEAGWDVLADEVWVTAAPETTVIQRLKERGGLSAEESLARIRAQLSQDARLKKADVVINTDRPLGELKAGVGELWRRVKATALDSY